MASLSVRKLDKKIYEGLRLRAARHGVSMEEEARQIIYMAVTAPESVGRVFQKYFGPKHGVDLETPNAHKPHEPLEFDE
jgi:plasmid stability protein